MGDPRNPARAREQWDMHRVAFYLCLVFGFVLFVPLLVIITLTLFALKVVEMFVLGELI